MAIEATLIASEDARVGSDLSQVGKHWCLLLARGATIALLLLDS